MCKEVEAAWFVLQLFSYFLMVCFMVKENTPFQVPLKEAFPGVFNNQ